MKIRVSHSALGVLLGTLVHALAQTNVHRFGEVTVSSERTVTLELLGSVPATFKPFFDIYHVEASTDLVNWTPLTTLLRTNSSTKTLLYTDNTAANFASRYYRMFTNHLITPLPKPTGPHAVGTFSRLVTDPSRTNRYNIPTNSSFMIQFWYPTEPQPGVLPDKWMDKALTEGPDPDPVKSARFREFVGHSLPRTPLAASSEKYPLVIYSHGGSAIRMDNLDKMEALASHGYVVVAIDHEDSSDSVFPDGTLVHGTLPEGSILFRSRTKDVAFVLDELVRLNDTDPIFAGRLDLQRVGVLGWSFGGGTVGETCRVNDRVKAAAFLDGELHYASDLLSLGLDKPFISMNGTVNPDFTGWLSENKALFNKASHDAYQFQIRGADHLTFAVVAWSNDPTAASRQNSSVMTACLVSFFNKYLKNDDDHLLDNAAAVYTNVINFMKK